MNKLLVLLGIVLVSLVTACGSSVLVEGVDQITAGGGNGGSGGNDVTITTTTTDSATGGSGGQELPPELTVTYLGPNDGKLPLGSTAHIFDMTLMSKSHTLSINSMEFVLESVDGGSIVGSSGTVYFSNLTLLDVDENPVMGPVELNIVDGMATVTFEDELVLPPGILVPGKPNLFRLVADLSAIEDASGELMGREYKVSLSPFQNVVDLETGISLEKTQIAPQTTLYGKPMQTVVAY
jgi:hypothetical protein